MVLYADLPARRARQIAADLLVLVLIWAAVQAGQAVHTATLKLGAPGRTIEQLGRDAGTNLGSVAEQLGELPFVGADVRGPLDQLTRSTSGIVAAGQQQQAAVGDLAQLLGVVVAAVPILLLLLAWLPVRIRFARRASAAQRLVDSDADLDLFALRAMAHQPLTVLARISPDPAGDWRRGDPGVVRALALLELRGAGLRPPPVTRGPA
jgi:hypothetical protein